MTSTGVRGAGRAAAYPVDLRASAEGVVALVVLGSVRVFVLVEQHGSLRQLRERAHRAGQHAPSSSPSTRSSPAAMGTAGGRALRAANPSVSHRYPYPFPYAYHFTSQFYASPIHATPPLPSYSPVSLTKANIAAAELAQGARVTVVTVFSRITREKFKRNGDLFLMPRMRRLCGNGAPRALLLLAGPRTHLRDCATCLACWASHSVYSR